MPPRLARWRSAICIGEARLDNRADVMARLGHQSVDASSDIDLILRLIIEHGSAAIASLAGDFAFVVGNPAARSWLAARDPFGVRRLFFTSHRPGQVAFASRTDLLASGDDYDIQYLAEFIAGLTPTSSRTALASVRAVSPGEIVEFADERVVTRTFWSPDAVLQSTTSSSSAEEQIAQFRELLIDAVRLRLESRSDVWSLLSGGLDSSSVVSIAQWLAMRGEISTGLAGTVTYVDPLGTAADERDYSDAVVTGYNLRNEPVSHQFSWGEVLQDPPVLDQPGRTYLTASRDQQTLATIQRAGGRVLLTGLGGDNLVLGTMFFFADWLARGEVHRALREMLHRAALGRVSFWQLAHLNAVLPLVPTPLRRLLCSRMSDERPPDWLAQGVVRRYGLADHRRYQHSYDGRIGFKYADGVLAAIKAIPSTLHVGLLDDSLDIRHPFLYRPLVELALQLGPEMCVRPHARKWILREAMRGILPEAVRTRVGKGSSQGLATWPLIHERKWIADLLRDPILAQLGCVEPRRLRAALLTAGGAAHSRQAPLNVHATLDLEIWLQVRSGRWAADHARHRRISSVG
jgi:asparagine synthase (glutamine-hydrolysing)